MPETTSLIVGCVLLSIAVLYLLIKNSRLRSDIEGRALLRYETWRARDWADAQKQARASAEAESCAQLVEWKRHEESRIRRDALERSRASATGKATEHLAPYFDEFPFDPRDARFLGSPVDFLVFDGLTRGSLRDVLFAEVKTGPAAKLSTRERQVRDAVQAGRVRWAEVRLASASAQSTEATYFLPLTDPEGRSAGQLELLPGGATLRHWPGVAEAPRTYEIDVEHIVRRTGDTFLRLERSRREEDRFRLPLGGRAHLEVDVNSKRLQVSDTDLDVHEYALGANVELERGSTELLLRLQGGR